MARFRPEPDALDEPLAPSKSQKKRDMHELQSLGARLVEISADRLAEIELPEDLREAVLEARRISAREGKRRQLQYIGRLMREVDPAPIRAKFEEWEGKSAAHIVQHRRAEAWRERLLAEEGAMAEFAAAVHGADLQPLRVLIRDARKEQAAGQPPRRYRELFRLVRALLDNAAHGKAD
jgi:ribosome-associated protein